MRWSKDEYARRARVYEALRQDGVQVGKERVRERMKLHGITARTKRQTNAITDEPNLMGKVTFKCEGSMWLVCGSSYQVPF
jgi:hypothetical protein